MGTILGLRTVIYKVADIKAAKQWYQLCFDTTPYFDEPYYVGFNIGGYELGLLPDEGDAQKAANVQAYWGVDEIEDKYNSLIANGATEHEKPQNVGGDIVVATVNDPWGNLLGLIYNPSFKLP